MKMNDVSDAWSLMSLTKQSASVSNCFGHFIMIMVCKKISLSILNNMSKFIIKSLKFCIGNGLIEFGIPEM